ncbi:MAG: hypothetical protein JW720_05125 [Sedimentisphaerales bacterium]|nr:hypothetical protein [Sedimentisphaerales bacterium]
MRKAILLSGVIVLSMVFMADAAEKELGINLDLTYTSKWMSKGVEAYGQKGGLFKTIDFDFWGTGFGTKVTHRNATSSGYVNSQRFDYRPYFKSVLFRDAAYQTNYNISVGYEHYPRHPRRAANTTWEWIFSFTWPNLLGGKVVPTYVAHYEYPAGVNQAFRGLTGWVHRFILGYDVDNPELPAPIHLSAEAGYSDGLGGRVHDWAYFTLGASTKIKINDRAAIVPGVYHQLSVDDSICKRDVTYAMVSMKYKFK